MMAKRSALSIAVLLLIAGSACSRGTEARPVVFEPVPRPGQTALQATIDGSLSGSEEAYGFTLDRAVDVSVVVQLMRSDPQVAFRLVKRSSVFGRSQDCVEDRSSNACSADLKVAEPGEYIILIRRRGGQEGSGAQSPVPYRLFVGIQGPGYVSIAGGKQ